MTVSERVITLVIDGRDVSSSFAGEVGWPAEARSKLGELRRRHPVIIGVRITELDASLCRPCEGSLYRQNSLRVR